MKIFQIIPTLTQGGAEQFVVDLSNGLSNMGHDVTIVQMFPREKYSFFLKDVHNDVRVINMDKHLGFDIFALIRLFVFLFKEKPDIVNTHLDSMPYIIFNLLGKTKFFHTVHNDAYKEAKGIRRLLRFICFKLKLITPITISDMSERSFERLYKLKGNVIYNGREYKSNLENNQEIEKEIREYRRDDNTKILVVVARLCKQKRQDLMVRVTQRLLNEGYNISTLLIGCIEDEGILKRINDIGCKFVYYLGERTNIISYLANVDAFCLCSEYEGMPISIFEALYSGAIPICTPVGGIVDVIQDGETGFISNDISEESYFQTLKTFLNTPNEQLKRIKSNAYAKSLLYDMAHCVKLYNSLYIKK